MSTLQSKTLPDINVDLHTQVKTQTDKWNTIGMESYSQILLASDFVMTNRCHLRLVLSKDLIHGH